MDASSHSALSSFWLLLAASVAAVVSEGREPRIRSPSSSQASLQRCRASQTPTALARIIAGSYIRRIGCDRAGSRMKRARVQEPEGLALLGAACFECKAYPVDADHLNKQAGQAARNAMDEADAQVR